MIKQLLKKIANTISPPEPPIVKEKPQPTQKELATLEKRPWCNIVSFDLDEENIHQGSFELDWNEYWVIHLIKMGYKIKDTDTDDEIVDRWFTEICRNIVLEMYEQEIADPKNRSISYKEQRVAGSKNLGGGRREVS